jgi:radical SAM protein with 4Fe4S-binding SPASM domain
MDVPLGVDVKNLAVLQLETTNICNSHCTFCPHDKLKSFGDMTDELYTKIIWEASRLPGLTSLIPMLTGEPFCDKKILERLKFASKSLPRASIQLYTNGSLLTKEILDQLKEIPRFGLNISLNGLNPETRKKVMGLDDWFHVVQMCNYVEKVGIPHRITAVATPEVTQDELEGFIKAGGTIIQYQSWAGQQYPHERKRWTSCTRAMNYMTVRYDGSVCLCCFDPFGKVIFGNLNTQTLEEVWNSKKHQDLILKHKEGRGNVLNLCEECTEG